MSSGKQKEKKQAIQVFVRVRPLWKEEGSHNLIDIHNSKELSIRHHATQRNYAFDRVFGPQSEQIDVYKMVAEPTVAEVISGYNCTVLAYGQTGTGKTYTMVGNQEAGRGTGLRWFEDKATGLIPRTLSHMFNVLRAQHLDYSVRVSYLELYNEELFDLLSPVDDTSKLKLYEDCVKKGSVIVQGLTECTVDSKLDVFKLLDKGAEKRRMASTLMNAQSSRSHTVFCITVHTKESATHGEDLLKTGKLYLVDLAGSENIKQSGASEMRAREACSINQSLLTLGRCIVKLMERSTHIPYRESKLTRLLQDSLGGRTKTTLIATISPASCNVDETVNTLEYALRAKSITNKPEVNERLTKSALMKEYTMEIERLKKDLMAARTGTGVIVDTQNYDDLKKTVDSQRDEIINKINLVNALREEKSRIEATCNELKMSLSEREQAVQLITEEKLTLEHQLQQASTQITQLHEESDMKEYLVQSHTRTEQILQDTTRKLISVADATSADANKLHDKLDAILDINKQNKVACEQRVADLITIVNHMLASLTAFYEHESSVHARFQAVLAQLQSDHDTCAEKRRSSIRSLENAFQMFNDRNKDNGIALSATVTEMSAGAAEAQRLLSTHCDQQVRSAISTISDYMARQHDINTRTIQTSKEMMEENKSLTSTLLVSVKKFVNNSKTLLADQLAAQKDLCSNTEQALQQIHTKQQDFQAMCEKKVQHAMSLLKEVRVLSAKQLDNTKEQCDAHTRRVSDAFKEFTRTTKLLDILFDSAVQCVDDYSTTWKSSSETKATEYVAFEDQSNDISKSMDSFMAKLEDSVQAAKDEASRLVDSVLNKQHQAVGVLLADRDNDCDTLGSQLTLAISDLETCSDVLYEESVKNVKDMQTVLTADLQVRAQHESEVCTELEKCKEDFKKFFMQDIKEYKQTGETPVRKTYKYPRTIAETIPRDQIVAEYKKYRSSSLSRLPSPSKLHRLIRTSSTSNLGKDAVPADENKPAPLTKENK